MRAYLLDPAADRSSDDRLRLAMGILINNLVRDVIALGRAEAQRAVAEDDRRRYPDTSKLTPRRLEVLTWLLDGHPTVVIADRLGISPSTVAANAHAIYRHFGVHTRAELMAMWVRRPADDCDEVPTLPVGWGEGWLG